MIKMENEDKVLADQAWGRMEEILDQQMPVIEKRRRSLFWWIGLSALILVSILAYANIDVFSDQSDINQVKENQIFADNKVVGINGATRAQNNTTEVESIIENTDSPLDDELALGEIPHVGAKNIIESTELKKAQKKYKLDSKESDVNRHISDNFPASVTKSHSVAFAQDHQQRTLKKFDTKQGRNDIKNELSKIYNDDYASGVFEINKNTVENADVKMNTEVSIDRSDLAILDKLPVSISVLRYDNRTFNLSENQMVGVVKSNGDWMFGGFASYQYLDKYFMGYDIGITSTYDRGGRFGLGMKMGYERLQNTNSPVLSDARVGVPVLNPDGSSIDANGSIFNSTKNAGFELNDVLLSINNLMMEFTVSYKMSSRFSLSSGLGYKRLLSVSTRPISGLDSDSLSDPNFELNTLDNYEVLNSPSVNRNKFYIPIETQFTLKKKLIFGIGTQLSINRNFEKFDEKATALYTRVSFRF